MNKHLDEAISRLRELSEEQQQAAAALILDFLDHGREDLLTPEQWAEVERRLDEEEDEIAEGEEAQPYVDRLKA
jgi:hypothetical protein